MREKFVGMLASGVTAALLSVCMTFPSLAATSPIRSISITVSSGLSVGDMLPQDIGINETGKAGEGEVSVSASNGKYTVTEADWSSKNSKALKSGDEPGMTVTLEPTDVSSDYFLTSYRAGNFKVSGGSFISASRTGNSLEVRIKLKALTGAYDPPADVYWDSANIGTIRWTAPENTSGKYDVELKRGNSNVKKISGVSVIQYNFYPYMTKSGEYTVTVKTVPVSAEEKKYGKASTEVTSGELKIDDRDVSDGKGQDGQNAVSGSAKTVGWSMENNKWYFRYPSGALQRGGWGQINGSWFYFNVDGTMQTGWQYINNKWYLLYDNGDMAVGWVKQNGRWYYLIPSTELRSGESEGQMAVGWRTIGNAYYFFNADGAMYEGWLYRNGNWYYLNELANSLEGVLFTGWIRRNGAVYFTDSNGAMVTGWNQIDGNWYYFYPSNGQMAVNTTINSFYVGEDGIYR